MKVERLRHSIDDAPLTKPDQCEISRRLEQKPGTHIFSFPVLLSAGHARSPISGSRIPAPRSRATGTRSRTYDVSETHASKEEGDVRAQTQLLRSPDTFSA